MKKVIISLIYVVFVLGLASCKNNDYEVIRVVATSDPHEKILIEAIPLLKEKGYTLDIQVISDYKLGNPEVAKGRADANYFQHLPYLNAYNKQAKESEKLVSVAGIHIEPIGLYGGKKRSLSALEAGDTIAISDSAPDYGRIVQFLNAIGWVTVASDFDPENAISHPEEAIISKKKAFEFVIVSTDILVTTQKTKAADYVFINGNFAIEGGLEANDALQLEPTINNPYVNIVAVKKGNESLPKIKALIEVLTSDEIKQFIINQYQGTVIGA